LHTIILARQDNRKYEFLRESKDKWARKETLMTETPIEVPYPVTEDLHLSIALAACRFKAEPGEGEAWITGTCHDPTAKRLPRILEEGGTVRISEGGPSYEHIPAVLGGVPRYELAFGKERPFALTIETGASEFALDLGVYL
jgi:hypothetical protein